MPWEPWVGLLHRAIASTSESDTDE